ncbi:MAG: ComF family protein, partial [Chloroflexota bacterium]
PPSTKIKTFQARLRTGPAVFIATYLLDLIFPPRCVNCGRVDYHWCDRCQTLLDDIPLNTIENTTHDTLTAIATTGLHTGLLQHMVQSLKYEHARALAPPLAGRMAQRLEQLNWPIDSVAAVPLHTHRLRERGYNQSKDLTIEIAELLGLPDYSDFIVRDHYARPQVGLNRRERQQNVAGAFSATARVQGRHILLVDDVFTTGATLSACAEALLSNGAGAVYGMTVTAAA